MVPQRQPITPEITLVVDPDSGEARAVTSSFPRHDWKARQPAGPGRLPHPGTALQVGESWFEIVDVRASPTRPGATVYDLSPWQENFTIRVADELTPEACRAAARRYRQRQNNLRKGALLRSLAFLTGLLPAEDQLRFEREYGAPAMRATFLSSVPLLAGSVLALFVGFAAFSGHDFGAGNRLALALWHGFPLLLYLFAESLTRLRAGLSLEMPVGSLFVAGPINVARSFRDAFRDTLRAPPKISEHAFAAVRDTVRRGGPEADLEVLSRLPKDHWTVNTTGVIYRGTCYLLVDRRELDEGVERHRFLLRVPDHEVIYQHIAEYDPTEVPEIYRARRRRDAATWVEIFRLFWGLLDHDRQERLAATYDYDPDRMTKLSILWGVVVGGVALVQGFARMRRFGGAIDVLEFFAGLALLWECAVRWKHWRAGRWRQSMLSFLSRPLAERFLRWEPVPCSKSERPAVPDRAAESAESSDH